MIDSNTYRIRIGNFSNHGRITIKRRKCSRKAGFTVKNNIVIWWLVVLNILIWILLPLINISNQALFFFDNAGTRYSDKLDNFSSV